VAAIATMSGVGVVEADSRRSFTPIVRGAAGALPQLKEKATDVGVIGWLGVIETMKLCAAPGAISTGVLAAPVGALFAELVVW